MNNISLELAEFFGWHLGDGCISVNSNYFEYTLTGDITEEYPFYKEVVLPTFNKIFKKYLKKPAILKFYKSNGVCGIYIFDKSFINILNKNFGIPYGKKINIQIPKLLKNNEQKIRFIRGLLDTDGSIYFCRSNVKTKRESLFTVFHYKPKIKIATISKPLIEQSYEILSSLDFSPRLQKPIRQRRNENVMYSLVLDTKKDTAKWIEEIGFKNLKHITKVNMWKKFGFCPPYTTLNERLNMLKGKTNPLKFYLDYRHLLLNHIKGHLLKTT